MKKYEQGRVTSMSKDEMEALARKYLPELFTSDFDRLKKFAHELAYHLVEDLVDTDEIRSMDPERIEPVLKTVLEENPFIQFLYVVNSEGQKITHNITHIEDRGKYASFQLDSDFSNRPWFIAPLKDGKIHVSDFYTSKITNALCITVSGPVRDEGDEIIGVLGIDIRFEDLAKMDRENIDQ